MELQNKIDIAIISASRPKLLPYLVDSFKKYIFFHGKFNWMLHEDFVYEKESNKVLKFCKKRNIKSYHHDPPEGIGNAIELLLNESTSDYVFILQDDWEFELPIDLSHILFVMDKHPHINGIFFNKRDNLEVINGYHFKEEEYCGLRICLTNQWPLFNGIWRRSFVKHRWNSDCGDKTQESHWNRILVNKGGAGIKDYDILKNKVGGYIYGPLYYPRTIRHLGYTWAVKPKGDWPIRTDGYGGKVRYDLSKQLSKERAPWLPEEEKRPLYLKNKKKQVEEWKKLKE